MDHHDDSLRGDLETWSEFSRPTMDQWRELAEPRPGFLRDLTSVLPGGLEVEPLYDGIESEHAIGWPGQAPFVRGSSATGHATRGWQVCQRLFDTDPRDAGHTVTAETEAGATAVWMVADAATRRGFDPVRMASAGPADGVLVCDVVDLEPIVAAVERTRCSIHLDGGGNGIAVAAAVAAACRSEGVDLGAMSGSFGWDPLGALARDGELPYGLEPSLERIPDLIRWALSAAPGMTALTVSTLPYQTAGADPVLELAFATATGVEYLRRSVAAGVDVDVACRQIRFVVGIGRELFVEAAKLRALRRHWGRVVEVFGANPDTPMASIHAVTSPRTMSRVDPWVNSLRTTVEAFAAVIGGADCVTILPFDSAIGAPDELGRRMARNVHTIMREESQLHRIVDPAGGSSFVERMTDDLARAAWTRLQAIEGDGGMAVALAEGAVTRAVADAAAADAHRLATRRTPVTGASTFPNLSEVPVRRPPMERPSPSSISEPPVDEPTTDAITIEAAIDALSAGVGLARVAAAIRGSSAVTRIQPMAVTREAAEFERLRASSDRWLAIHGSRPKAFLANIGPIPVHRLRSDFTRNLLEAGGIETLANDRFEDIDEAAEAFARSGATTAAICSSDETYEAVAAPLAASLRRAGAATVLMAGQPGDREATLREAGIDHFLFSGCDALAVLTRILRTDGVIDG